MFPFKFALPFICFVLVSHPASQIHAWGAKGHTAIGILSMTLTDDKARQQLQEILGSVDDENMKHLCNWPDEMRELPEWDWATPQHYVNIPRSETSYDASRDCPEGYCATEAVKKYAAELADERLPKERRRDAFAWLCHVVGDMHQPLHAGFADDRGGNDFMIMLDGKETDLHSFWDEYLVDTNSGSVCKLVEQMSPLLQIDENKNWNPSEVNEWTNESHDLASRISYPEDPNIDDEFKQQSWKYVEQQIPLAARRLSRILNATLGEGEVKIDR